MKLHVLLFEMLGITAGLTPSKFFLTMYDFGHILQRAIDQNEPSILTN